MKVFDAMRKSVVSAFTSLRTSAMCVPVDAPRKREVRMMRSDCHILALHVASCSAGHAPSTFETKWTLRSRLQYGLSASVTITGPRSEPPAGNNEIA